jgi:hypothetical protein
MKTTVIDRRDESQKLTHTLGVVGKDRCMSNWGAATGGASRALWAFDPNKVNSDRVFNWVKARSEMSYVTLIDLRKYRAPYGTAHLSIYVCDENHVAAKY